ncbi:MAG: aminoglycoside phosphotransferase [Streptomycetaceae bacterium]|nr:aminoglycoside phosphotransferase [Streptomycetaceae bacterium]
MTSSSNDPRIELARHTIGDVTVIADPALPPRLLRLTDAHGNDYLAKHHTDPTRYAAETHAYRTWGRHLTEHLPELISHHDASHTLLFTAVPGRNADTLPPDTAEEEQTHHDAGLVLALLHRATSEPPAAGAIGAELAVRLHTWVSRAERADLLSTAERRLLLEIADQLAGTRMDSTVCHLDYQPRNWLYAPGNLWVCDLEHMRRDARIRDFARLAFRRWQTAPHLRTAFFTGYGARLTSTDERLLKSFGAIEAATAIVRGHERDDAALTTHGRTVLLRLSRHL